MVAFMDRLYLGWETENKNGTWCLWKSDKKGTIETVQQNSRHNCQTEERGRKGDEIHCVRLRPIPLQPAFDIMAVNYTCRNQTVNYYVRKQTGMWISGVP